MTDVHTQRVLEQLEQAGDDEDGPGGGADSDGRKTMPHPCFRCGTPLSPQSGRSADGRVERTGICPDCRLDGVGGATVVRLTDPDAIPDRTQERLERRQRGATPQTTSDPAAFIDRRVPAGTYVVTRIEPTRVRMSLTSDFDAMTRADLADRLKQVTTNRRWYVQSFPTYIDLVDMQEDVEDADSQPAMEVIRGP